MTTSSGDANDIIGELVLEEGYVSHDVAVAPVGGNSNGGARERLTLPAGIRCCTGKANDYAYGKLHWVYDTDNASKPKRGARVTPLAGALVRVDGSASLVYSLSTAANSVRTANSNGWKTWEAQRPSDGAWIKIGQFRRKSGGGGFHVTDASQRYWDEWRVGANKDAPPLPSSTPTPEQPVAAPIIVTVKRDATALAQNSSAKRARTTPPDNAAAVEQLLRRMLSCEARLGMVQTWQRQYDARKAAKKAAGGVDDALSTFQLQTSLSPQLINGAPSSPARS